jgi:hypothetical protein
MFTLCIQFRTLILKNKGWFPEHMLRYPKAPPYSYTFRAISVLMYLLAKLMEAFFQLLVANSPTIPFLPQRKHTGCNLLISFIRGLLDAVSQTIRRPIIGWLMNADLNKVWEEGIVPITVAACSKAWTVFVRSNTGVIGSNLTQGKNLCLYSVFVLSCVGSGLATGWSPARRVLPTVYEGKAIPVNRPWRFMGLWDVEVPTFPRLSVHTWR